MKAVSTSLNTAFLTISRSCFKQRSISMLYLAVLCKFLGDSWEFRERDFFSPKGLVNLRKI